MHANLRDRQLAAQTALAELNRQPIFLDTETTGLKDADEIIEIGIIDYHGVTLYESLVRTARTISPGALRAHNISTAVLRGAPTWAEVWPQVKPLLEGKRVGIYNARFDLGMIQNSHRAHKLAWAAQDCHAFCIMELYAQFYGEQQGGYRSYRWQSLDAAGRQCGIKLPAAHRAVADAQLARAVLLHMAAAAKPTQPSLL